MSETETELFVKNLQKSIKRSQMTDKEKLIDDWSSIFAGIVILLLVSTTVWAIIHFIFALAVTWLQVFGALVLFNLAKSFTKRG